MKNALLFMLMIIGLFSCENIGRHGIPGPDLGYDISVFDSTGNDLLDTNNVHAYDITNIRMYDIVNDEPVLYYKPTADLPYGYYFETHYKYPELNYVSLKANYYAHTEGTQHFSSIIEWEEGVYDTVSFEVGRPHGSVRILKIYYKGELMWDMDSLCCDTTTPLFRHITITK